MTRVGVILAGVLALGVVVLLAVYGDSLVFVGAVLMFAVLIGGSYLLPDAEDFDERRH